LTTSLHTPLTDRWNASELGPRRSARRAVVLAGGRGTRLAPYTQVLPKPLMPIGDQAILEIVIGQLQEAGVTDVTLSVGYLSHLIRAVLDNASGLDVDLRYVQEQEPLGTAAPLRLIDDLTDTFVAMNGDVLSDLDYDDLIAHHSEQGSLLTIATHERVVKIDYGVLAVDSTGRLRGFQEKPEIKTTVSMGIYVLEPEALSYIPADGRFDLPDLVEALLDDDRAVGTYHHEGLWFDIGRQEDYATAATAWLEREVRPRTRLRASAA
jgi:NDP-sugar pyrophosphorylase family protein